MDCYFFGQNVRMDGLVLIFNYLLLLFLADYFLLILILIFSFLEKEILSLESFPLSLKTGRSTEELVDPLKVLNRLLFNFNCEAKFRHLLLESGN